MSDNPTDYAAMTDDEVNHRLMGALNPDLDFSIIGDEELWRDKSGKAWGVENYCSEDAPVSLRIEMVEAVVKAGKLLALAEYTSDNRRSWGLDPHISALARSQVDPEVNKSFGHYMAGIATVQPFFARAVLAAMESENANESRSASHE